MGFETCFITLREERRLRVFGRKVCVPKKDEVTAGWRNSHVEALHDLYALPTVCTVLRS